MNPQDQDNSSAQNVTNSQMNGQDPNIMQTPVGQAQNSSAAGMQGEQAAENQPLANEAGVAVNNLAGNDGYGGYAQAPEQNFQAQAGSVDPTVNNQNQMRDGINTSSLMGAGVIDPSDTGSFMQESTQLEPVKKGGKKKILIAVIAAFFGVSLFLGISLFLKSQKTSAKVLDSFSESTSNLTSEGNDLASAISKTTYGGSSDVGSTNLENDVKAFDEAVAKFEDVTNRLKSDRKTLKGAAQAYISEIKAYKSSVIDLAVDNAKIQALTSSLSSTQFGSNVSNASEFSAEADKASAAYAKAAGELKDLSLSNEKAKELRDLYVAFIGEMQTVIKNLKVAVNAGDRSAILDESSKFSELTRSHPAIAKEDEVREALGVNSEAYEKLEAARAKLNEEISKVRY